MQVSHFQPFFFCQSPLYICSSIMLQVLVDNIKEYAPIVYTPTVGLVCQNYSGLFRRPRGMYFSAADRGEMMSMVYNWPADQVVYHMNLFQNIRQLCII